MFDGSSVAILIVAGAILLFLVGKSLINAYFTRKEEFVNLLKNNLEGKSDASSK